MDGGTYTSETRPWSDTLPCATDSGSSIPDFIYLGPLFFLDSYLFFFFFFLIATVGGSGGKECACNVGDPGLILGLGRYPGEGNNNPLLYSSLENPMDRGAWRVIDSA